MRRLSLVLAASVLVAGIATLAIAQSSPAPRPVKACAKKRGGDLRIAKRCKESERRVSWAKQGPAGPAGPPGLAGAGGAEGTAGKDGAPGTSTGRTLFASAGTAQTPGAGACEATPAGPSIDFVAPEDTYVQVMAQVTQQAIGSSSNLVCLNVDGTNSTILTSTSTSPETRYLVAGSGAGTADRLRSDPVAFPVSAGEHTMSLTYAASGGSSEFSNRKLWVTLMHPEG
jgi:hypothetical protein